MSYILDILESHFNGVFYITTQILPGKFSVFWIAPANYTMAGNAWILFCSDALLAFNASGAEVGILPENLFNHDDVIKWKHFPRNWPFVREIHWSPVNSPQKGQWRGSLVFSLICARINDWVNNREADDLRGHRALYDVIVMNAMPADVLASCVAMLSGALFLY